MEGKKMKKKGFTLVELLVVIAIIAMLLAILMPALAKVRTLAQRIMCGTNVGGIGKAMLTYASDDKYESYPIAGPSSTIQDLSTASANAKCNWKWNCKDSPGTGDNTVTNPESTVSACLYLLVKYSDVPPEQFICPGGEEKKFELANYKTDGCASPKNVSSFTDAWDFGTYDDRQTSPAYSPGYGHNSYSYQQPLPFSTTQTPFNRARPISATSAPVSVVLADRSPWFVDDAISGTSGEMNKNGTDSTKAIWATTNELSKDFAYLWNSYQHQKDGQSVLYADQHVKFEKLFNVGVDKDNIYATWCVAAKDLPAAVNDKNKTKQFMGARMPNPYSSSDTCNFSQDDTDTYLVQDLTSSQM